MSFPEPPALTDVERIIQRMDALEASYDQNTKALNNLGANLQWLIDQAQGIFKMFSSPQFMNQILSGGFNVPDSAGTEPAEGPAPTLFNDGTGEGSGS